MEGQTVLIADDDPTVRELMMAVLRTLDVGEVSIAATGEEALEIAQRTHPRIVLLDQSMPGLLGSEVCERLKADPTTQDIRILLFSGLSPSNLADLARDAHADGFLVKPFTPTSLLESLKRIE
ncbi:MAG: response regulator, partial [Dehalococcoidia bacterium]